MKGNILTFCEELSDFPIENRIVSEEDLKLEPEPATPVLVKAMGLDWRCCLCFLASDLCSKRRKRIKEEMEDRFASSKVYSDNQRCRI